ncbi:TetR/AcrR family transcriptional regulator [Paenibacillus radicis (ex Gao et al. 2016)]|uniref:TetR family transcriptional regulator n=1 Tax=Paenibacillus radicis (ex Gao et al. 2016) TaxID=1737354 RepID=A0A917M235_9BACL|nr:TetR/AcrR family transcriptional regulator [Paenibacillus radicis (ex Gao et al. 2016)]GGG70085.1 TetR family transcriptional regulator [Paenibacillus radicis (ex Gao et al. 2016)]
MARSKEYDENEVLLKAMQLFWEQGYERTSMSELVEFMGIHRRSLYETFTDKHTLFLKSLDRYGELMDFRLQQGIIQAETAAEALHFIFKYTIDENNNYPLGCLFVNAAVELAVRDADADMKATEGFAREEQLLEEIIDWGKQNQEFSHDFVSSDLAESMHNTLLGLRVMARTSISKEKLYRIADSSMKMLEG